MLRQLARYILIPLQTSGSMVTDPFIRNKGRITLCVLKSVTEG